MHQWQGDYVHIIQIVLNETNAIKHKRGKIKCALHILCAVQGGQSLSDSTKVKTMQRYKDNPHQFKSICLFEEVEIQKLPVCRTHADMWIHTGGLSETIPRSMTIHLFCDCSPIKAWSIRYQRNSDISTRNVNHKFNLAWRSICSVTARPSKLEAFDISVTATSPRETSIITGT